MPKRVLKQHLEKAAKIRRKSIYIDDSLQLSQNNEDEDDNKNEMPTQKPRKHMQYLKLNQNNEVERLLLHTNKTLVYQVDHSNFPAFNVGIWPQENLENLINYPSCGFSVPRPVFISRQHSEKIDICYKRPMVRDYYKMRIKHTRTSYQTALKSNKALRSSAKDNIYHSSVYDLAARMYTQPDPYFHSSYDYYFTGGNLSSLPQQGNVIHAGGIQLQEMMVSEFLTDNDCSNTNCLNNISSHKTSENCEIFEVQPLITSLNCSRQNCFIARQRNLVSFNYLNDCKEIKTVTQFRTKSTPFISFAQSQRDINTFIITTMKQHIRLYDLSSNAPALVKLFEISPKTPSISWNTIKPWRENTFLYANEKQFYMIDVRTSPEQWLRDVTAATDSLMCDHISAVQASDFNNLFYVATNHKLQCMDVRQLRKFSFSDTYGAVCRWTHQLRYAPLLMDTLRLRQSEYIALSSPIAGDLHICQLSRERNENEIQLESSERIAKHIYTSPCLPYQPPTLLEAYEHARLSGKCLRPEANMEARLKRCTTGMKFLSSSLNDSIASVVGRLLISNSNGDIFAQTLSKRENSDSEERCNTQSDEIMADFHQKLNENPQMPLNYTEIKNMKGLRKVFLCTTLSSVKKFDFDAMENEYDEDDRPANNVTNPAPTNRRPKRLHLGRWQKPLSTLHSYKDALVSDLLSIWDIDIEEEKHIRLGNLRFSSKQDPAVKVEDWLKTNMNPNPPMLTIPTQEISRYNENDTSQIFETSINMTQTQNTTIDFENAVHSTQIMDNNLDVSRNLDTTNLKILINNESTTTVVEKLKNKKKTKKYVKGF